ncbi:MAG: polysaccharide biosynthesis PFTS motif protein [Candidatus Micrarchaeota archaeon]
MEGMKKIAVFESIGPENKGKALSHLKEGFAVLFREISPTISIDPNIKNALEKGSMKRIESLLFDYPLYVRAWEQADKIIDELFTKRHGKSNLIKNTNNLFRYKNISAMYKKKMLVELCNNCETIMMVTQVMEKENPEKIILYPSEDWLLGEAKELLGRKVELVLQKKKLSHRIKQTFQKMGFLLYPWYMLLKKVSIFPKKKEKFQVAISIDQTANLFSRRNYGEATLIDEKELPKEKVLFIDESRKYIKEKYAEMGFCCTSLRCERETLSLGALKDILFRFFPCWIRSIFCIGEDWMTVRMASKAMSDYILWRLLLGRYKINNYVRRMVVDPISKIAMLRESKTKTWLYYPDASTVDHTEWNGENSPDPDFNFIDYDRVVVYGNRTKRFFQSYRHNKVGTYFKNGIWYSQIAKEIETGKIATSIGKQIKAKTPSKNAIFLGIFDTTFSERTPLHPKDGEKFGKDMLNLLEENKDYFMIFKVKYPWAELTDEIRLIYEKLRNHERCLLFPTKDGDLGSSAEVIAKSDFVIGAVYTSPVVEALGTHKKAIYYDVSGYDAGKKGIYFSDIPDLVAHSYGEMKELMAHWMKKTDEKKFDGFLNKYVKGEMDEYLDQKAINRFRKMLMD